MEQKFVDKMLEGAESLGITLSDRQIEQFYQYYEMLVETNKVMNLTAITEMDAVVAKHFIDSLSLKKAVAQDAWKGKSMIDVGTGAGFPGIPLKIAFPELHITLLDSLNKRVKFLNEVIEKLELEHICAVHGRAEDFGRNPEFREQFDFCVSRAVSNIATLSEYCLPFVKVGGYFVSYKSLRVDEEMKEGKHAVEILGGEIVDVVKFQLPGMEEEAERALALIQKKKKIGNKYPRKAGVPSKEPLK